MPACVAMLVVKRAALPEVVVAPARSLARSVNHNPTHHWSRTTGHVSSPEALVFHSFFPSILI